MPHHNEPDLDTLPKLLRKLARQYGDRKIAMRVKDMGIWKSFTWQDYYDRVRDLCLGLVKLGFQRDDKICIIGENKPEWFWAELAAQSMIENANVPLWRGPDFAAAKAFLFETGLASHHDATQVVEGNEENE